MAKGKNAPMAAPPSFEYKSPTPAELRARHFRDLFDQSVYAHIAKIRELGRGIMPSGPAAVQQLESLADFCREAANVSARYVEKMMSAEQAAVAEAAAAARESESEEETEETEGASDGEGGADTDA